MRSSQLASLSPGRVWLLAFFLLATLSSNLHAQKEWYYRGTMSVMGIKSVSVVDSLCIYILDNYSLRKTTNGGASWIWLRDNNNYFQNVKFWTKNSGMLIEADRIMVSSNGGSSWQSAYYGIVRSPIFIDSLNLLAFHTGSVYFPSDLSLDFGRSTNGGRSWSWKYAGLNGTVKYADKVDSLIVAVGYTLTYGYPEPELGTMVIHSTNNGIDWIVDSTNSSSTNWTGMVLMHPKTMIAVSGYKVLKISTTGGGNAIHYNLPRNIYSPRKSGDTLIYAGSDSGYIAYSRDRGLTFEYIKMNTNASIKLIEITKDGDGYAFAEDGKFYSTVRLRFAPVGIEDDPGDVPASFTLPQNFPNPFNPATVIRYALPSSGHARGVVYDILGREVATLLNTEMPAGEHQLKFDAKGLPSGVYIFRLEAGEYSSAIKMVVEK